MTRMKKAVVGATLFTLAGLLASTFVESVPDKPYRCWDYTTSVGANQVTIDFGSGKTTVKPTQPHYTRHFGCDYKF